jgi:glucan phosphoethanolaminetransferase (alkaline phosphatase superfamily)
LNKNTAFFSSNFYIKAAANPTVSASNLAVGQAICIPSGYSGYNLYATAAPVIVTQAACASYYTVFYSLLHNYTVFVNRSMGLKDKKSEYRYIKKC